MDFHQVSVSFIQLISVTGRKRSTSKNLAVSPKLRKEVLARSLRLRIAVKKAALHRMGEKVSWPEKIKFLEGDIRNAPSHVFGEHDKCHLIKYFKCIPDSNEENLVPAMKSSGLYSDIEAALQRLIYNASSLLLNMDNNLAEHFNSIVCKFVGGKRINFSLKGSYQSRCEAAALSFNTAGDYHGRVHRAITGRNPQKFKQTYISRTKKKRLQVRKKKFHPKVKSSMPDEDYGPEACVPPLPLDDKKYKKMETEFLNKMKKTQQEIQYIERATVGQADNPLWIQERVLRITASHFGQICKMRQTTSRANCIKNMLYNKFSGNQATRYGIANESHAIQSFREKFNKEVKNCGLFIDKDLPFLGATPDGLVEEDKLLEIKCPSSISKMSPEQGIAEKKITFAELKNNQMRLKRNHAYYFQVQGQLAITRRKSSYFCIWSPLGLLVEEIEKDHSFWENEMLPKLKDFYFNHLLPELIDPQYPKGRPIRK